MGRVYKPAEDSLLILRHVKRLVRGESSIWARGGGILAIAAAEEPKVDAVVAVDVNPEAIDFAPKKGK